MKTSERRQDLREKLLLAGEAVLETNGLAGLKARELAARAECALGAIYTVFPDLDTLILALNARTMEALGQRLAVACPSSKEAGGGAPDLQKGRSIGMEGDTACEAAARQLVDLALAYLDFATANLKRWRALFDHRMPAGHPVPEWYANETTRLFAFIEGPLSHLEPTIAPETSALLARSLFSAVHGMVTLGLEEKIGAVPVNQLEEQLATVVGAVVRGLQEL